MSSKEDDETTQPSVMPPQPKTKELPAVSPVEVMLKQMEIAITASMQAGFRETNANIDLVTGDVKSLKADVRSLQEWKLGVEKQPVMTSDHVRAIADGYTSQVDLQHEATLSAEIVKNRERDKKIAETHTLALAAASELAKQSRAMGIGVAGLKWVVSKEGRATLTQLAILIGVLYGTLKTAGVFK